MAECHVHEGDLADFTARQPKQGSPETRGFVTPAMFADLKRRGKVPKTARLRRFTRKFINDKVVMPDGQDIEFWGFEDERGRRGLPSPAIRVSQGDIVQVTLESSKQAHTIHLHGIEPDDRNDGVGHSSFEVTGSYTYQFSPAHAGTYFYHCHVNTVLHVQMGMFGILIVDPPGGQNRDGSGRIYQHGPRYDTEAILVPFELDPEWRKLSHAAGLSGEDVGLHNFNPEYFLVNGAAARNPSDITRPQVIDDPRVAIRARVGQRVLVRFLNGGYFPTQLLLPPQVLPGRLVAHDGRPFVQIDRKTGKIIRNRRGAPVHPIPEAGVVNTTVAERVDMIINPHRRGRFLATILFRHWIDPTRVHRVDVPIIVRA